MEVTRLFDLLDNYIEKYPDQEIALSCKREGEWKHIGIQKYIELTDLISYGLLKLGIEAGDRIGIISNNLPEWNLIDFATMQVGAISTPIYPTISREDYEFILHHAEMKLIFLDGKELRKTIEPLFANLETLQDIYTFAPQSDFKYLDQLIELGRENPNPEELARRKAAVKESDVATIIYTSGTTGVPKGVMLTHSNIVNNFKSIAHIPSSWSNKALSFLPVCHAYERMLVYLYHYLGMSVYYTNNLAAIGEAIKEVNPTMMSCVPRLLEKIYEKLYASGKKMPFFKRQVFFWAFKLAQSYQLDALSKAYKFKLKIADRFVYSKIRDGIGGNFDIVVSGGSAIQAHIASFFSAIGMPVFEGYGLSETSPVIAVSDRSVNGRKFGTVGRALRGVEVRLAEQGEIICRGHNVMKGYYKAPELTAEVIDEDGWFHTGDTGAFTPEGQLVITGRLKSLFKTSLGKYVNPQLIESKFTESLFFDNMIVLGANQKFAAALIVVDFNYLKSWCVQKRIEFTSPEEMLKNPKVLARLKKEINKYNSELAGYEKVRSYEFLADEWSMKNGLLSPTLKVKRKKIEEKYPEEIERLFK